MKPDFSAIRSMLSAEQDAIAEQWDGLPLSVKRIVMGFAGLIDTSTRWQFMKDIERAQLARAIERAAGQFASLDAAIADYKDKARTLALSMKAADPPADSAAA